jgi:enoyl-CoA hydratase/carnithine racemase
MRFTPPGLSPFLPASCDLATMTERPGTILVRHDNVLLLTIDRPEVRNALHPPALRAIIQAIEDAGNDKEIGAIVITGAGRRAFCAGLDLRSLAAKDPDIEEAIAAFEQVLRSPERVPIVAAVCGNAIGGGFELMLKCDLAVAGDNVVFSLPEVTRGLVPGGGATLLPARIPLAVAIELGLTGLPQSAGRLFQLGLINQVVPADDVVPAALALAGHIAKNAPLAVAATRELMWTTFREGAMRGQRALEEFQRETHPGRSREVREGLAAFAEKRRPDWRP